MWVDSFYFSYIPWHVAFLSQKVRYFKEYFSLYYHGYCSLFHRSNSLALHYSWSYFPSFWLNFLTLHVRPRLYVRLSKKIDPSALGWRILRLRVRESIRHVTCNVADGCRQRTKIDYIKEIDRRIEVI